MLVTGAGGFIGSHLAERLAASGARVRALVHYRSDGFRGWLESSAYASDIEVVSGDMNDSDTVREAVRGCEMVFHLAALVAIPYSYRAPASYIRGNIEGTLNLLQAAIAAGVAKVVHTSTSEVYGSARHVPMDENHPLSGQSPYSASKIAADKIAEAFHLSYRLPVATIRPFNTFGPRQSARAVVPAIITQALASPEIRLGSLTPTRDFTFVADTVEGFLRVAESPAAVGQVTNIGTGREISIGELAELILKLAGRTGVPIVSDRQRLRPDASEVSRLCADATRARSLCHWHPKHSLEDGLSQTIEWIRNNPEKFRVGSYAI